jgi:hypothetical protein
LIVLKHKLTFLDEKNDGNVGNKLPTGLAMPTEAMIYLTAAERSDATERCKDDVSELSHKPPRSSRPIVKLTDGNSP